jgi:GxxExxY protein
LSCPRTQEAGLRAATQLPLPVIYVGERMDLGFRIDLLVENTVVVEIKAVDAINPVHLAQVITYLKLSGK